jgi:hypothetical protein
MTLAGLFKLHSTFCLYANNVGLESMSGNMVTHLKSIRN